MSASQIIKGLWIGDMNAAVDKNFFIKYNIGAVINCTPNVPMKFKVKYMHIDIDDSLQQKDINKMIEALPYAISFIHKYRDLEGKNVLVHCHAGMQRSAAIVVAYLSHYHKMTLKQAIKHVIRFRPVAFHHGRNVNFEQALLHYTKKIN